MRRNPITGQERPPTLWERFSDWAESFPEPVPAIIILVWYFVVLAIVIFGIAVLVAGVDQLFFQ